MQKTLKAGTYYIGDPCYIFEESWGKVLDNTKYFKDDTAKLFDNDFFCSSTAHGDGLFEDQNGCEYPVDAGCISCLPISLIEIDNKVTEEDIKNFGKIVTFKNDFVCQEEDGIFNIGDIIINTRGSYGEDEEDDYDDGDEEGWEDEE